MMTTTLDRAPVLENSEALRNAMVASQLRTSAVNDPRVVAAMAQVERERFLPAAQARFAYADAMVELPGGRRHNNPLATGRLLTEARVQPGDKVLLVGAAGGYAAALLAKLAGHVVALEEQPDLVAHARAALAGIGNVELVEGPLGAGWAPNAPYDLIVVDGAIETVPSSLVEQARPGARLATGLVDRGITRLATGERATAGFGLIDFADCVCTILPGFEKRRGFTFGNL
ncbi:protein-L-isoaspartate O-methyltransferase [Sphingomonas spermidinifaciens]|uniref:Protein-L-isoaspartate O-methyltransferase n=1 Tax=Sphingomonas spermidinifaciens TaxID=1141889 RepID=A0A2A4B6B1_9SPHN|nr:protein-L-isoaspartate O-methyltransferase [Sphingomonas spermidinifaciens]PCD03981.1 protein-L-isoaspartate O-methyltransferase [Sphingomonas spermidinifaciens]